MKKLILIFLLLTLHISFAQDRSTLEKSQLLSFQSTQKPEPFHFFTIEDRINWEEYDLQVSESNKGVYAEMIKEFFTYFFEADWGNHKMSDFIKNLHFIDLNNDQVIDIIYEGWGGGESDNVQILLNDSNKKFTPVFDKHQYVESLDIIDGKLCSITILDFGCCAEYIEYETKYKVDDKFNISIIYQRAKPNYVQPPKKLFEEPKFFLTMNNDYTLRASPVINDTGTIIYDAVGEGNVIARYPKNAKGIAWAEEVDKEGKIWWLVEMYPMENLKYNLVFFKDSIPTREIGWMSSKYLSIHEN